MIQIRLLTESFYGLTPILTPLRTDTGVNQRTIIVNLSNSTI